MTTTKGAVNWMQVLVKRAGDAADAAAAAAAAAAPCGWDCMSAAAHRLPWSAEVMPDCCGGDTQTLDEQRPCESETAASGSMLPSRTRRAVRAMATFLQARLRQLLAAVPVAPATAHENGLRRRSGTKTRSRTLTQHPGSHTCATSCRPSRLPETRCPLAEAARLSTP